MADTPPTAELGLVEVHAHLIPAVDDGSRSVAESLRIAAEVVRHGYRQLVCTSHIWPSLPHNTLPEILRRTAQLQAEIDATGIPLRLHPGGEINLHAALLHEDPDTLPTYANLGRHYLVDTWLWKWESWLTPVLRHLQKSGRTVILAHPERLGMLQERPELLDRLSDLGVLFQGNLYCFADPPHEPTRQLADRFLDENRYFMLGGDLHREDTLPFRFDGLSKVIARVGLDEVRRLVRDNPLTLLPPS